MGFKIFNYILLLCVIGAVYSISRDRNNKPYRVVCYLGTWAYYRPGQGKFQAEDINPNICTHINYGFAKLQNNKIALFDPDLDTGDTDWHSGLQWGHGMIRRFNHLRTYNPHLTSLISIGGWNEGSNKYSEMVRDANNRAVFVRSVVEFLQKYDFDGLDLDWEYPAMAASGDQDRVSGRAEDKHDYISLLKELKAAFEPYGYILTAAVSAGKPTIDRSYDIPEMSKHIDFINLMAYDFHGGWDKKTAHNAPLYPYANYTERDKEFTVQYAVDYWLKNGFDSHKLVLGMPLYGRTFTLAGPNHGIGAPVIGKGGQAGPITRLEGMLGYNEICAMIKFGWALFRDSIQKIPYAVHANQWIGFDDKQSITEKVNFLKSRKLGGAMVWSIDTDDFVGHCGEGKYPLLKAISKELNNVDGPDVVIPEFHATTPSPEHPTSKPTQAHPDPTVQPTKPQHNTATPTTTSTTPSTTTTTSHHKFVCKKAGFFKDPYDSRKFHQCVDFGNGNLKDYEFMCGEGSHYNEQYHVCV